MLLRLSECNPAPERLRLSEFSDDEFVRLPPSQRDTLREQMLADITVLRAVLKEVHDRARTAVAASDIALAKKLIQCMRRLGVANTGPRVTRLSEIVGQAYVKLADERLAELKQLSDKPRSRTSRQ